MSIQQNPFSLHIMGWWKILPFFVCNYNIYLTSQNIMLSIIVGVFFNYLYTSLLQSDIMSLLLFLRLSIKWQKFLHTFQSPPVKSQIFTEKLSSFLLNPHSINHTADYRESLNIKQQEISGIQLTTRWSPHSHKMQ